MNDIDICRNDAINSQAFEHLEGESHVSENQGGSGETAKKEWKDHGWGALLAYIAVYMVMYVQVYSAAQRGLSIMGDVLSSISGIFNLPGITNGNATEALPGGSPLSQIISLPTTIMMVFKAFHQLGSLWVIGFSVEIIVITFLNVYSICRLFSKADIKGWKALIPVYNIYCAFELIGTSGLGIAVTYTILVLSPLMAMYGGPSFDFAEELIVSDIIVGILLLIFGLIAAYQLCERFSHPGYFSGCVKAIVTGIILELTALLRARFLPVIGAVILGAVAVIIPVLFLFICWDDHTAYDIYHIENKGKRIFATVLISAGTLVSVCCMVPAANNFLTRMNGISSMDNKSGESFTQTHDDQNFQDIAQSYGNSGDYQTAQKEVQNYTQSDEFKAAQKELQDYMQSDEYRTQQEELQAYMQSDEYRKQQEELQAYMQSDEFRAQQKELQDYMQSDEFKAAQEELQNMLGGY